MTNSNICFTPKETEGTSVTGLLFIVEPKQVKKYKYTQLKPKVKFSVHNEIVSRHKCKYLSGRNEKRKLTLYKLPYDACNYVLNMVTIVTS